MFQNYLKITLRNLNRRRAYSFINVLGLAVAVAVCLVISKYVEFETSYDSFHTNAKNIYRVVSSFYTDRPKESYTGYDLAPSLLNDLPEIKRFARTHGNSTVVTFTNEQGKDVRFYEPNILVADSTFLDMFTFKFHYGNSTALYSPNSIVLTESVSKKYFGNSNPIGKELNLFDNWPHLNDRWVKQGEKIKKAQTIGSVGNTGISINSHLHYEVLKNGKAVDPGIYLSNK